MTAWSFMIWLTGLVRTVCWSCSSGSKKVRNTFFFRQYLHWIVFLSLHNMKWLFAACTIFQYVFLHYFHCLHLLFCTYLLFKAKQIITNNNIPKGIAQGEQKGSVYAQCFVYSCFTIFSFENNFGVFLWGRRTLCGLQGICIIRKKEGKERASFNVIIWCYCFIGNFFRTRLGKVL